MGGGGGWGGLLRVNIEVIIQLYILLKCNNETEI